MPFKTSPGNKLCRPVVRCKTCDGIREMVFEDLKNINAEEALELARQEGVVIVTRDEVTTIMTERLMNEHVIGPTPTMTAAFGGSVRAPTCIEACHCAMACMPNAT